MPESPGAEKQDKEKDHRDSKKNRGETNRRTTHACVDRAACRAAGILVVSLWETKPMIMELLYYYLYIFRSNVI